MSTPRDDSLVDLIGKTVNDGIRLIKAQVALAQQELRDAGRAAGNAGIAGFIALVTAVLFVIFLLITLAYVIVALGLPTWAGFGIVAALLLISALIAAAVAKAQADKITGPTIAVEEFEKTRAAIAEQFEG